MNKKLTFQDSNPDFLASLKKTTDANDLLDFLEIDRVGFKVNSDTLYDLFMDKERFEKLVSKIRNKAFW